MAHVLSSKKPVKHLEPQDFQRIHDQGEPSMLNRQSWTQRQRQLAADISKGYLLRQVAHTSALSPARQTALAQFELEMGVARAPVYSAIRRAAFAARRQEP